MAQKAQLFDFYEAAAKHLKKCFPEYMIGGPAIAGNLEWGEELLCEMQKRSVPIDFFSRHIYCETAEDLAACGRKVRELMNTYGYENAESILNEWNYIRNRTDMFNYSKKVIIGIKGATFALACMTEAQHCHTDMLMYYDARPTVFSGIWEMYFYDRLKTRYSFKWYSEMYELEREVLCENKVQDIYTLCCIDKNVKVRAVITHYNKEDDTPEKEVSVDFGRSGEFEIYLLDKDNDAVLINTTSALTFKMPVHSAIMIKEK